MECFYPNTISSVLTALHISVDFGGQLKYSRHTLVNICYFFVI